MRIDTGRLAAVLAALWAGLVLAVGVIGTPAGFALLPRDTAGQLAGWMLTREARIGIGLSIAIFLAVRRRAHQAARAGTGSIVSVEVMLVLGVVFCTVLGQFGLRDAMDAAREGRGWLGFGTLHGLSVGLFGLKGLLLLTLAWRLTAPR